MEKWLFRSGAGKVEAGLKHLMPESKKGTQKLMQIGQKLTVVA